jgi:hypothetical protein
MKPIARLAMAFAVVAAWPVLANARTALDAPGCASLAHLRIGPADIGLATSGARVTATSFIPADAQGHPAHCLVSGEIAPKTPAAPDIRFRVALPAAWNGKSLMFGGGGTDGFIPDVLGNQLNMPSAAPTPLARGYAVFGSDSGHQGGGPDFGLNDEAWRNYLGDALKKTRDAATLIVTRAYATPPKRAYFLGTSRGGAEGLVVAARWPADWDGVVSLYPARNPLFTVFGLLAANQALAQPGAYPTVEKRALMYRAALERCDQLDGAKDGVISNVAGCHKVFDPSTATVDGAALRCGAGVATKPNCLSDAELAAYRAIEAPVDLPVPLGGETVFPGFNAYTSDVGRPGSSPAQTHSTALGFGFRPPSSPMQQGMPMSWGLADPFVRIVILRDSAANPLRLDLKHLGPVADRIKALAVLHDSDLGMSGFARKHGKILLMHGTDDMLVTPRGTEAYYRRLRSQLGGKAVDGMLRFYEAPGFGHSQSAIFGVEWDYLAALESWVEHGVDPSQREVMTDTTGVPGRTRPLCRYPRWPKYRGSGDINAAASFSCSLR